jgi:hypothetical protein
MKHYTYRWKDYTTGRQTLPIELDNFGSVHPSSPSASQCARACISLMMCPSMETHSESLRGRRGRKWGECEELQGQSRFSLSPSGKRNCDLPVVVPYHCMGFALGTSNFPGAAHSQERFRWRRCFSGECFDYRFLIRIPR